MIKRDYREVTREIIEKKESEMRFWNNITKSRNCNGRPTGPLLQSDLWEARVNNNRGNAAIISIATHLIVCQLRHTSCDAGSLDKSACR